MFAKELMNIVGSKTVHISNLIDFSFFLIFSNEIDNVRIIYSIDTAPVIVFVSI